MLRLLLTTLSSKDDVEVDATKRAADRPVTQPLPALRKPKTARPLPKSVCTSLKDLCEL